MECKKFDTTWIVRIDKGEELVEKLMEFAKDNGIQLASVSGIGAADRIEIGLFDTTQKKYFSNILTDDHEITNINGNISTKDGSPYLHLHITLANHDNKAFGGHLSSAVISGTCELVIREINGALNRKFDDHSGLNLFEF